MTLILVVSATSLAATVIASETSPLRGVLEDSITWRYVFSFSTSVAILFIVLTASTG